MSKNDARARGEPELWSLEPHCCRICFGRIVSQPNGEGGKRYQCSNCGHTACGRTPAVVCACGIVLRGARRDGRPLARADAGIRCHPNQSVTPEFPSLFVASYAGAQSGPEK